MESRVQYQVHVQSNPYRFVREAVHWSAVSRVRSVSCPANEYVASRQILIVMYAIVFIMTNCRYRLFCQRASTR